MFMAQTGKGWIDRADLKFEAAPLQRQHLRIAKCLRNDRIARVKITEPHRADDYAQRAKIAMTCSGRESSVFGLMISSVNFTKIGSSRKIAYLSIDSKSMAIKNGQGDSGSIRFPHLILRTSGIFRSCIRAFIIIASTRAGVTSDLSL